MTIQSLVLQLAQAVSNTALSGQKYNGSDASVEITAATNTAPIVITAAGLALSNGDYVHIKNATGNTAMNNTLANPAWRVTPIVGTNTYELDGSVGNGAYGGGGTLVPALIGTVDGNTHTSDDLVGFVNEARYALVKAAMDAGVELTGSVLYEAVTFAADGTGVSFARPDGFIEFISLLDRTSPPQPIHYRRPEALLPVRSSIAGQHEAESATRRYVFEKGNTLIHHGGFITAGTIADLQFYGSKDITITNVIEGTATEVIADWYKVLELATAIANGKGELDPNALAKKLLKVA